MKIRAHVIALLIATVASPEVSASPRTDLCKVLRGFAASVQPDEKREFTFSTSWGSNFKDDQEPAFFAKRCIHDGYGPAKAVCDYLMEQGYVEFADANVEDAISCLSKTTFDPSLNLNEGDFSFSYGSERRGALIDITFHEDKELGGMAFRLTAHGY
jgi:hypothetical protein